MLLLVEPLAPGLFIIKTLLDPAPCLGTHAKNQLSTGVWAFFWLSFVPLIFLSICGQYRSSDYN